MQSTVTVILLVLMRSIKSADSPKPHAKTMFMLLSVVGKKKIFKFVFVNDIQDLSITSKACFFYGTDSVQVPGYYILGFFFLGLIKVY